MTSEMESVQPGGDGTRSTGRDRRSTVVRETKAQSEDPTDSTNRRLYSYDPQHLEQAFATVPEIGNGHRWYDHPYKVLSVVVASRMGTFLPTRVTTALNDAGNYLMPWNDLDRDRAWSRDDPSHSLMVPDDEHVRIPSIWVAEFFPPSELANLQRAIAAKGWDSKRRRYGIGEANQELLEQSRKGGGWSWWRLGSIANVSAKFFDPDAQKRKLPKEFDRIELVASQIGPSLTVVVSRFELSKEAQQAVDRVWHADHEPQLIRGNGRPRAENRLWSGFRVTQESRRHFHDLARDWMTGACPGSFAHGDAKQPLFDLLLLERHDPSRGERVDPSFSDALRALGISGPGLFRVASEQLSGLLLESVDERLCPSMNGRNSWTLWGQTERVATGVHKVNAYGGDAYEAIGRVVDGRIRDFFVLMAMSHFLRLKREQHATLRDKARSQHGRFSRKDLQRLRDSFLISSLDTSSIARDTKSLTSRNRLYESGAVFSRSLEPWMAAEDVERGTAPKDPANINEELHQQQVEIAEELVAFDRDYRDILSTVASLGTSIDAFKVQRYAIGVALVSLIVALVTLVVTVAGSDKTVAFLRAARHLWSTLVGM